MDIQYIATTINAERFHLLADGDRPVLNILVAEDDTIWIAPVDDTFVSSTEQMTKGKVHRHPVLTAERMIEEGDVPETDTDLAEFTAMMFNAVALSPGGVCMASLYAYVYPRAHTLMARVYVPRNVVTKRESQ